MVVDAAQRVLLIEATDPANHAKKPWWEIPGGGIDRGETSQEAAERELHEETGISDAKISPPVWTQHVEFDFAGFHFSQNEWIHLARVNSAAFDPAGLESIEAVAFTGADWWPVAELVDGRPARILPPWLPEQLPKVLAAGVPEEPIDLGHVASQL